MLPLCFIFKFKYLIVSTGAGPILDLICFIPLYTASQLVGTHFGIAVEDYFTSLQNTPLSLLEIPFLPTPRDCELSGLPCSSAPGIGNPLFNGVSSKVDFRAPSKMQGPRNQNLCIGAH